MHHGTLKLGIVMHHGTQDQSLYVEFPATVRAPGVQSEITLIEGAGCVESRAQSELTLIEGAGCVESTFITSA